MKILATKITAQDGTYAGLQSGYVVKFQAPDVNTGKLTDYEHRSEVGYRGFNIKVHVTVNRGITKSCL